MSSIAPSSSANSTSSCHCQCPFQAAYTYMLQATGQPQATELQFQLIPRVLHQSYKTAAKDASPVARMAGSKLCQHHNPPDVTQTTPPSLPNTKTLISQKQILHKLPTSNSQYCRAVAGTSCRTRLQAAHFAAQHTNKILQANNDKPGSMPRGSSEAQQHTVHASALSPGNRAVNNCRATGLCAELTSANTTLPAACASVCIQVLVPRLDTSSCTFSQPLTLTACS
jgi:hypothetical protein